jgi:branched-chain amino acid transport system ATP-binding protein
MLRLSGLSVFYGGVQALWDVSITAEAHQLVAVLGNNGAGKTTLLNAVAGLLPLARGTIEFQNRAIHTLPAYEIVTRGVALVPEGRRIFSRMSVRENLEMGAYHVGARAALPQRLEEIMTLFPVLRERQSQPAGYLSGGEQQMLAIGRALMSRPSLLLLDEPSLGLAPKIVSQIFEAIRGLRAEGVTIIVVEQNVQKALSLADRAYVLESGRIVMEGPANELAAHPHVRRAYLGL